VSQGAAGDRPRKRPASGSVPELAGPAIPLSGVRAPTRASCHDPFPKRHNTASQQPCPRRSQRQRQPPHRCPVGGTPRSLICCGACAWSRASVGGSGRVRVVVKAADEIARATKTTRPSQAYHAHRRHMGAIEGRGGHRRMIDSQRSDTRGGTGRNGSRQTDSASRPRRRQGECGLSRAVEAVEGHADNGPIEAVPMGRGAESRTTASSNRPLSRRRTRRNHQRRAQSARPVTARSRRTRHATIGRLGTATAKVQPAGMAGHGRHPTGVASEVPAC